MKNLATLDRINESVLTGKFDSEWLISKPKKGVQPDVWERAVNRATKDGSTDATYGQVIAIYKVYRKRADEKALAEMIAYQCRRAENEDYLERMFR